ncbi:MAG: DUF5662 family protein [Syntrophomonadaceae bacterium]|nr:DUF5662 family protein [Syntrophomonadaceae bacterium]
MKYLVFLNYLIRHKWHVLVECCRYGVPWRGICHDISKFLPDEFVAYANYYHTHHVRPQPIINPAGSDNSVYYSAWLIHQKRNPHHWQWWILYGEDSSPIVIPMPDKYIKEMVADWHGAGKAQGQPDIMTWYEANKGKMLLHVSTRRKVEQLLQFNKISAGEHLETAAVMNNLKLKAIDNVN